MITVSLVAFYGGYLVGSGASLITSNSQATLSPTISPEFESIITPTPLIDDESVSSSSQVF